MSALAAIKTWSAESAERILAPLLLKSEQDKRDKEDADAGTAREALAKVPKVPKALELNLANADIARKKAQIALDEANANYFVADIALRGARFTHDREVQQLQRVAVAPWRVAAALELVNRAIERLQDAHTQPKDPGDAMRRLFRARQHLHGFTTGDSAPPKGTLEEWLDAVLDAVVSDLTAAGNTITRHDLTARKEEA